MMRFLIRTRTVATQQLSGLEPIRMFQLTGLAALMLVLASCSSDDGPSTVLEEPTPSPWEGEWLLTVEKLSDSCNPFFPVLDTAPILIESVGSEHAITFNNCVTLPFSLSRDVLAFVREPFEVGHSCAQGCTIVVTQTVELTMRADDEFAGVDSHQQESTVIKCDPCSQVPCELRFAWTGSRCSGCWTGCTPL